MLHKPTQNPTSYGVFACLYNMCRRMFDVQQHEARSQVFVTSANMPKTLLFAASLLLFTTCCRRMFDVQQHEALSQVFMPFCKHAQNPAIYSDFASLCNVRLIEYVYSWVWHSQ